MTKTLLICLLAVAAAGCANGGPGPDAAVSGEARAERAAAGTAATQPTRQLSFRHDPRGMVVRVDGELAEALADGTGDLPAPLAELAVLLRGNPDLRVVVEGHTDSVGEGGYNQRMSERLAEAVRDAMIQSGIDARRLRAIGRGEEDPLASNATELGRRLNHRIEIVVAIPRELAERLTAELEPRFAAAMAMQP